MKSYFIQSVFLTTSNFWSLVILITTCNLTSYGFNRAANIILLRQYRQKKSAYEVSTSTAFSTFSQHFVCELTNECGYVTLINNAFVLYN